MALKVECYKGFDTNLFHEYEIYKDISGCPGISKVYWYAIEVPFNVMVIDRFEVSLDELVRGALIDICMVVSFADQMGSSSLRIHGNIYRFVQLNTLESIHIHNLIHCDIKPENFMIRFDQRIYLIDFGLAQYFRDNTTQIHVPLPTGLNLIGTICYTSINSHMGFQQTQ